MLSRIIPAMLALFAVSPIASAYPEFQQYAQKTSGRNTNCAMCHAHPDGPEGLKPGQIGSLTPEELNTLGQARAAFEPGQNVQNPILNEFGNEIVKTIGKTKFLQIRLHPEELPTVLDAQSDLDRDGIPNVDEFVAGTHPLDEGSGDPARLIVVNLRRYSFHLVMLALATASGVYGLNAVLHGFDALLRGKRGEAMRNAPNSSQSENG